MWIMTHAQAYFAENEWFMPRYKDLLLSGEVSACSLEEVSRGIPGVGPFMCLAKK